MKCNRCDGTGFLNFDQVPTALVQMDDPYEVLDWIEDTKANRERLGCSCHLSAPCYVCHELTHDVQVCDCCGNGQDSWHGEPGEHYNHDDPEGMHGPYGYNGGFCECH